MQQEIQQLKQQVQELLKWKEEKTRQQISFPLDNESKSVISKNRLVSTEEVTFPTGLLSSPFYVIEVYVNGYYYWLMTGTR